MRAAGTRRSAATATSVAFVSDAIESRHRRHERRGRRLRAGTRCADDDPRASVGVGVAQANGASDEPAISGERPVGRVRVDGDESGSELHWRDDDRVRPRPDCEHDRRASLPARRLPAAGRGQWRRRSRPTVATSPSGRWRPVCSPCGSPGWIFVWDRTTSLADCVAPGIQADITHEWPVRVVHVERRWSRPTVHERHRPCVRRRARDQHDLVRDRRPQRRRRQWRQRRLVDLRRRSLRLVPYRGDEPALPDNDSNGHADVVVHDRDLDWTTAANRDLDFDGGNGASDAPAIAPDGALVAFESAATDLVDGDTLGSHRRVHPRRCKRCASTRARCMSFPRHDRRVHAARARFPTDSAFRRATASSSRT